MAADGSGSESGNGPVSDDADPGFGGLLSRLARSMGPEGVELGGENVRFEQDPDGGLEARITLLDGDGRATSVASMYLPSDTPPPTQPPDVPFVPHAPLRVIEDHVRGVLLAMWMLDGDDAPPPGEALVVVLRSSREAGWRLEAEATEGPLRLLRGDLVRRVESMTGHMGPVVSLAQKRRVGDAGVGTHAG